MGTHQVVAATAPGSILIYDIRKPSIIVSKHESIYDPKLVSDENELNDFDIRENTISMCFDSGDIFVNNIELMESEPTQTLTNKHTNICHKCYLSDDPSILYSLGFDYKIIQWNLKDNGKSQSRNVYEKLKEHVGEKSMQYNPPFGYCMEFYDSQQWGK